MSGIAVVGELLLAHAPLIAVVPEARIRAGALPESATLPAIVVTTVSVVSRNVLKPGAKRRVSARVTVTVLAASYEEKLAIIKLVRTACADKIGNHAGVTEVAVHLDTTGPDIMDEAASMYLQDQDLRVGFNELA